MLSPLVTLLHNKGYRDRLVDSCFEAGGVLDEYRPLMETFEGGALIHWRWSSVASCVDAILRRRKALEKGTLKNLESLGKMVCVPTACFSALSLSVVQLPT